MIVIPKLTLHTYFFPAWMCTWIKLCPHFDKISNPKMLLCFHNEVYD